MRHVSLRPLLAALVVVPPLAAQDRAPRPDSLLAPPPAAADRVPTGFSRILPVVFVSPLTGFAGGATLVRIRRPDDDAGTRPTSLRFVLLGTTRGQLRAGANADIWTRANALRLTGGLEASVFPQPFFGIGPRTLADDEERYTPRTLTAFGALQRQVLPGAFVSAGLRVADTRITRTDSAGVLRPGTLPGSTGYALLQLEGGLTLDTRDNIFAPAGGWFVQGRYTASSAQVVSTYGFQRAGLDVRTYLPAGTWGTLAAQLTYDAAWGTVPFDQLPSLGGNERLRAYVDGRFTDRHAASGQLEWRQGITPTVGFLVYVGGGLVAPSVSGFRLADLQPAVGAGLRWIVIPSERVALRVEFGQGRNSRAINLGFGEAF